MTPGPEHPGTGPTRPGRPGPAGAGRPRLPEPTWTVIAELAGGDRPRYRFGRAIRRHLDLLRNSGSLMASTVVTSVLGFAYWWLAARSFPADAVGSASAAVSAMTLIGTLGMFGMGTLLIAELPRVPSGRAGNLIAACLLVAGGVAATGGVVYVALVYAAGTGLRDALGSPAWTAVLVFAIVVNAMALVLDEALVGMLAGGLQLLRNTYFSVGKLAALAALVVSGLAVTGGEILATWVAGILLSGLLLAAPLRRRLPSLRPRLSMLRGLYRQAFDYNLLNVALFLPRTALPLVVTAVLSASATAGFYTAWMVFTFLAMVPGTLATTLFAVTATGGAGADETGAAVLLRSKMRMALFVSVAAGVPASLLLAALARPVMGVFGSGYADAAAGALAILALSYLPTAIRQLYVAVARVRGFVRAATALAVAGGVAELAAAWYGGARGGLTSLAAGYAVVVALEAIVMAPVVLRVALARPRPPRPARHVLAGPEGAW